MVTTKKNTDSHTNRSRSSVSLLLLFSNTVSRARWMVLNITLQFSLWIFCNQALQGHVEPAQFGGFPTAWGSGFNPSRVLWNALNCPRLLSLPYVPPFFSGHADSMWKILARNWACATAATQATTVTMPDPQPTVPQGNSASSFNIQVWFPKVTPRLRRTSGSSLNSCFCLFSGC